MTPATRQLLARLQLHAGTGPMYFIGASGGRYALVATDTNAAAPQLARLPESYSMHTLDSLKTRGYVTVADQSTSDLDYRDPRGDDTRHGWQITITPAGATVRTPANATVSARG